MNWSTSDRRDRLPGNWRSITARIRHRDGYRCTMTLPSGKRCPRGRSTGHSLQVDHIRRGDDHREENLRTLCVDHHTEKTQGESAEAQALPPIQKRTEPHPGARRKDRS